MAARPYFTVILTAMFAFQSNNKLLLLLLLLLLLQYGYIFHYVIFMTKGVAKGGGLRGLYPPPWENSTKWRGGSAG
jgi:hypothetical protein